VDDLACQPSATNKGFFCSVVGSHGVAVIDVDDTTFATTVRWTADVQVYSGERSPPQYFNYSYSVCAGWIYNWDYGFHPDGFHNHFCRTDLATDGTVVVSAAGHHGYDSKHNCSVGPDNPGHVGQCQINFWPVFVYDGADGTVVAETIVDDRIVTDVAVDGATKTVLISGYNQTWEHTDKFNSVVQIAYLDAFRYDNLEKPLWTAWGFNPNTIAGLLADTRMSHVVAAQVIFCHTPLTLSYKHTHTPPLVPPLHRTTSCHIRDLYTHTYTHTRARTHTHT
jgi:hypothetical protein